MSRIVLIVLMCITCVDAVAQTKQTEQLEQLWLGYLNQTRISDKWGVWGDLHLRARDHFAEAPGTGIFRVGITRYIRDDLKLTAGYGFINHFPADNHLHISQPEHRPWQQVQWHTNYPRLRIWQILRLEERWRRKILDNYTLADGYSFNFRLRYNFLAQFPLNKKSFKPGSLSMVLNDELHINFGKQIVYNYFDQNRFFAGLSWHLSRTDQLQFGYSNVFVQLSSGNRYRSIHVPRVYYIQSIDLRKRKK